MRDKLKATINSRQLAILEGIAYRIADIYYMRARYVDEAKHEINDSHNCLMLLFADADREKIPFFVQNTVICYFENFKNYHRTDVSTYLEHNKHYDITLVR